MRGIESDRIGWGGSWVPPLQGGRDFFGDVHTWGFTPGYHVAGFQPWATAALKGRHVTARAGGPGMRRPNYFFKPCKGDIALRNQPAAVRDAESAEVLGNIKALL